MDCSKMIDFFPELKRLCDSRTACTADAANKEQCPLHGFCRQSLTIRAEEIITAVENLQKWSDEHPKKTYAQDFFEKFPDAQRALDGTPFACKKRIYDGTLQRGEEPDCTEIWSCKECWNEPMEE